MATPDPRLPPANVISKQDFSPEEQEAFEWLLENYRGAIDGLDDDLARAVRSGDIDLGTLRDIRAAIRPEIEGYASDIEQVQREGTRRGAEAGRRLSVRRHGFDIAFDEIPESTLEVFDEWASEATGEILDTMTDEVAQFVRGAHEEGLSIDEMTDAIRSDMFEGRLNETQAERVARTATISSSNAGSHSAHQEVEGVVAERWGTTLDGRERDAHAEANGQIAPVDGTFTVDGEELRYPGDPRGSAENIINCRCYVGPVFADDLSTDQREDLGV